MSSIDEDDIDGVAMSAEDLDGAPMQDLPPLQMQQQQQQQQQMPFYNPPAASMHPSLLADALLTNNPFLNPNSQVAPQVLPFVPQVAASKLAAYEQPTKVLTPFDKKKQEMDAKRAKQEADDAAEYAKFVQTFDTSAGGKGPQKAFVSGGIIGGDPTAPKFMTPPAAPAHDPIDLSASPRIPPVIPVSSEPVHLPMEPSAVKTLSPIISQPTRSLPFLPVKTGLPFQSTTSTSSSTSTPAAGGTSTVAAAFSLPLEDDPPPTTLVTSTHLRHLPAKHSQAAADFLEELKQQSERPSTSSYSSSSYRSHDAPRDTGDFNSTNLFVGNLAPDITEKVLIDRFSAFGDIASVKIMWPRREEGSGEKQGFVCFMRREDAVVALREMHSAQLAGLTLRLNWSRAIPLPPYPIAYKNGNAPSTSHSSSSYSRKSDYSAPPAPKFELPAHVERFDVIFPSDSQTEEWIDRLASDVNHYGPSFEQDRIRQADPRDAFLTNPASLDHLYYRWRLSSLSQGDSLTSWVREPFRLTPGGPYFIPPDPALSHHHKSDERDNMRKRRREEGGRDRDRDRERDQKPVEAEETVEKGKLSELAEKHLMGLLRSVSMERAHIRDVMCFCLGHSDASRDIVELIAESLTLDETPLPKKIARLYVVSDLLHNSAAPVPNASSYRSLFEAHLPAIFGSIHRSLNGLGRMTSKLAVERVRNVLNAWYRWNIFTPDTMRKIELALEKGEQALPTPV